MCMFTCMIKAVWSLPKSNQVNTMTIKHKPNSYTSLKLRGAGIYTSEDPKVVLKNAETRVSCPLRIAADALACGLLWTYSYGNAKFHFSVDPHHNRFAGIHVTRIL